MLKRTLPAVFFLIALSVPPRAQEPSAPTDPAGPMESPLPSWLHKARRTYEEALRAQEEGDLRRAEKLLRKTMNLLSRAEKSASLLSAQDPLDALFGKLESAHAAPADTRGAPDGLDVSPEELEDAPSIAAPPQAEKRKYTIPVDPDDPIVKKYIAVYTGPRRGEMEKALERMGRYRDMVVKTLREEGLPRELLYLPLVESEYLNTNVSRAGAVGLWQFMPDTARGYGLKVNYWVDERKDPEKATRAAAAYLKKLHRWFDDWHLALASYNRGEFGVQRDMQFSRSPDFSRLAERRAIPSETEQYVPRFAAFTLIADNAAGFGFRTVSAKPLETDQVVLGKPIDLKVAAECAGTTEETLRELNPTLRVWCTPKNDPDFALRIPAGAKDRFLTELAKVKDWTPGTGVVKYKVKKGDHLGIIAKKFKTTVKAIQSDNKIKNSRYIHPGQILHIRPGR